MKNSENSNSGNDNPSHSNKKRSRRSKNDSNGRTKQCKHCDKSYLSDIALNSHVKAKHPNLIDNINRSRGRPRKSDMNNEDEVFPQNFNNFFEKTFRKKEENSDFDIIIVCKESFDNIFNKYKEVFLNISSPEEYSFIGNKIDSEKSIDKGFWKYLLFISTLANKEYFEFVFKFIVLFRESILIQMSNDSNFTSKEDSSEIVPDCCNEFVGVFMEKHNNFGLEMNELINIIQHFCNWLWENQYTSSRLSLLSNS